MIRDFTVTIRLEAGETMLDLVDHVVALLAGRITPRPMLAERDSPPLHVASPQPASPAAAVPGAVEPPEAEAAAAPRPEPPAPEYKMPRGAPPLQAQPVLGTAAVAPVMQAVAASPVWTPERVAYLHKAFEAGDAPASILVALNNMPGTPVSSEGAILSAAAARKLKRPASAPKRDPALHTRDGAFSPSQAEMAAEAARLGKAHVSWVDALRWAHHQKIDVEHGTDDEVLDRINAARIANEVPPFEIVEGMPNMPLPGPKEGVAA